MHRTLAIDCHTEQPSRQKRCCIGTHPYVRPLVGLSVCPSSYSPIISITYPYHKCSFPFPVIWKMVNCFLTPHTYSNRICVMDICLRIIDSLNWMTLQFLRWWMGWYTGRKILLKAKFCYLIKNVVNVLHINTIVLLINELIQLKHSKEQNQGKQQKSRRGFTL